jgi:hypothetical protein
MTAPTAELDRLEADLAAIGGTFERRIGAGCQQLANDLLARVADLLSEADWLDVRGATLRQDLADLRARIAALEPPPLPPRLPGGARSGLPWASGERHGSVGRAALQAAQPAFEALRGRPADFEHLFLGSWDGTDVNGQRFADVANGLYDDYHTRLAGAVAAKAMGLYTPAAKPDPDAGLNPTAKPLAVLGVRIGWEANSTAYPWAHPFCGGDYAVWRQALARAQAPWRAAFPGALFALNFLRDFTAFAPSASFSVADLVGPPAGAGAIRRGRRRARQARRDQRVGGLQAGLPGGRPEQGHAALPGPDVRHDAGHRRPERVGVGGVLPHQQPRHGRQPRLGDARDRWGVPAAAADRRRLRLPLEAGGMSWQGVLVALFVLGTTAGLWLWLSAMAP